MQSYRWTLLFFVICFWGQAGKAQDPRFSQFYAAPVYLNPAMSGVFPGAYRIAINYRDLYASIVNERPFRTMSAAFEYRARAGRNDFFSMNLQAQQDQAGLAHLRRNQAFIGGSFLKKLSGGRYSSSEQFLVAGAQVGIAQQALRWDDLWFSAQYNTQTNSIDPNGPSGEAFAGANSRSYLDFNAGILWYAVFDDNASFFAGGALHHINQPSITFLEGGSNTINRRWTAHLGGEIPLGKAISAMPGAAVSSQGPAMSITLGNNFRITNHDWKELALRGGLWVHASRQTDTNLGLDALIVAGILEMERWNLGFSYDVTASSLRRSNYSKGAMEVSLIYVHPASYRSKVECPKY
ncbi:MAG: PorP/SprF family type IX secretion system membrane protein [Lewinellaceae bacterium]|nr:PorP/SprF family type IX secretion system membrane protein [Lewinellaceae bacterium]